MNCVSSPSFISGSSDCRVNCIVSVCSRCVPRLTWSSPLCFRDDVTEDEFKKFYGDSMYNALTRDERVKTAPRVPRFAPISTTSGRWIDAGLRPGFCMDIISWDAPVEVWRKAILQDGFFNRPILDPVLNMGLRFEAPFYDEQLERAIIWSHFGVKAALDAYEAWRSALTADLGPADIMREVDYGFLGVGKLEVHVWDSAVARARFGIFDFKDSPVAMFEVRHKLKDSLESRRVTMDLYDLTGDG